MTTIIILTLIIIIFISYLIYKDSTIIHKSISFSYYEDKETAVIWGSFAGVVGMIIIFSFSSIITLIAGICLTLIPIAGNFNQKPITYIHYSLAATFYFLMLFYTHSYELAILYIAILFILLYKKYHTLSLFWLEIIGIAVIIIDLFLRTLNC